MAKRSLIYGGSFDPIGNHHLLIAQLAREAQNYDEVVFIPSYSAPHKTWLAPFEHRAEMVRRAIAFHGSKMRMSRIEMILFQDFGRKSYTFDTITALIKGGYGDAEGRIHLLVGTDCLTQLPNWYRWRELIDLVVFVEAPRNGVMYELAHMSHLKKVQVEIPLIDVNSTLIRNRRKEGKSIDFLVPRGVQEYILQHGLYSGKTELTPESKLEVGG